MDLETGESACHRCNGSGYIKNLKFNPEETSKLLRPPKFIMCPLCFGNKKLTWTEQVFGKKFEKIEHSGNN